MILCKALPEEVSTTAVAPAERGRLSGEQAAHDRRQGDSPCAGQEVDVVREKETHVAGPPCCGQHPAAR